MQRFNYQQARAAGKKRGAEVTGAWRAGCVPCMGVAQECAGPLCLTVARAGCAGMTAIIIMQAALQRVLGAGECIRPCRRSCFPYMDKAAEPSDHGPS